MGFVYVGRDEQLRRDVAIKVLRSERNSDRDRARLEREAHALAALSHPNVVPVFEVGDHEGRLFIAMELVDGDSLRTWLRNGDRTWREVVAVFVQAARGLAAAHARGLVHRDFKPENALIGEDGRVRVVDFGVVSEGDAPTESDGREALTSSGDALRTRTGEFLGTPRYMAPEQFAGVRVGPQADQFAWCVALYEALARARPFAGTTISELATAVTGAKAEPLPPGAYPRALAPVLARGLARDPAERWADMDDLVVAVQAAIVTRPKRWPWIAGAGALAAAVVVVAVLAAKPDDPPPPTDVAPATVPIRLTGPATDMQDRAQDAFAQGHAAIERDDPVAAARSFDAAAAPFERVLADGEDIARIQLDRALAHFAAWERTKDPVRLVVAHELLRRVVADEYRAPDPTPLQARAERALVALARHGEALAAARGSKDPDQRFFLLQLDQHPTGTRIQTPERTLCEAPCTVPMPMGEATLLRLSHPGYWDVIAMARPVDHLAWTLTIQPMRRVRDGETYAPAEFPPF
jgi:predicted Ser/Thr protein kinase